MLSISPSPKAIKQTVFAIDPDSALGPAGFGGHYFHANWPIMSDEVTAVVIYFFAQGICHHILIIILLF